MKSIPLSQGKVTSVDDKWFNYLSQWVWRYNNGYAIRGEGPRLHRKTIYMHRVIMNASDEMNVDHIDHDGLNNLESNLRLCTKAENNRNTSLQLGGTSRYKGVSWEGRRQKWMVKIMASGKRIHLGYFTDEIEAARAYDQAARKYHGEFAYTNFRDSCEYKE